MTPRVIHLNGFEIGNHKPVTLIAGPCAMESRDHGLETAQALKELTASLDIPLIYKSSFDKANRTSITGKRGMGLDKGLAIFLEIKEKLGIATLTDVHTPGQCEQVSQVVDVLQIPAFLCRQTDLLVAAARTGAIINVKKGQFLAPWDMTHVTAKIESSGNTNIMVCERGVSFGYNTLVNDFRSLPIMAKGGFPVVFDATHSVQQPGGGGDHSKGQREMVPFLARAAIAVGVAALFMETHENPDAAPSDGSNMVPLGELRDILQEIIAFDSLAKKYMRTL